MRYLIFCAGASLALCGCQSTGATRTLTVPVGEERKIDYYYAINPDCSSLGSATIRVIAPPANGRIAIREGTDFPNFQTNNPRSECNTRRVASTQVWYIPNPGFLGTDSASVDIISASGIDVQRAYSIIVR
jgi:hypothetical protein